jgi:hypothetical protein
MINPLEKLTDAELVSGAAYLAAPRTNVIGLPESVEMMRRTKGWLRDLHVATVRLTSTLIVLTVALVLLTVALVYFAAHH